MEDVGHGLLVVGQIFVIGTADVAVDVLQLHEQQRDAVDETDDVGAAEIQRPLDPELAHDEKVVVLCVIEIENTQRPGFHTPARVPVRHLHAVAEEVILFEVGLQRRLRRAHLDDFTDRVVVGSVR